MSVETKAPTPVPGDRPRTRIIPGRKTAALAEEESALNMAKVPCDPAQVVVNHLSFRVDLSGPVPSLFTPAVPVAPVGAPLAGIAGATTVPRRRRPVVWSGQGSASEALTGELLQTLPPPLEAEEEDPNSTTMALPRVTLGYPPRSHLDSAPTGPAAAATVVAPRTPAGFAPPPPLREDPSGPDTSEEPLLSGLRAEPSDQRGPGEGQRDGRRDERQAFYPGRRMNLGVVLLPLRVLLGFVSVYAGMGKLCDPVYFDGGSRGSLVTWLRGLHPWGVAEPLRDFALAHPVGSGLTVAFLQVIVGVLTMLGLWQRAAASVGALLSAALIVTVSWRAVPVYEMPDFIYLAAWSPLIIAGAPVYSLDARLAGEAWRTLGPRVEVGELRRRVLRRGTLMATLVVGVTLLIGSMLGGAVRSAEVDTVPTPDRTPPPSNKLPGSPLPSSPSAGVDSQPPSQDDPQRERQPERSAPASPSQGTTEGPESGPTLRETVPPEPTQPPRQEQQAPPSAGSSSGTPTTGGDSGGDQGESSAGNGSGGRQGALGGLLG
ncbi:DoxX family membrane protein [Streptomyces sp. NPDC005438]|uniref:DoxX family protein n=1 Tax=Streptomyces sp. NPDC005438 TaxID=3156880 RepID=UPI0033BE8F45